MSTPLVTLEALKESVGARTAKEAADRTALLAMFDTAQNGLVDKLHVWAGLGFPAGYAVLTCAVSPPAVCIDSEVRAPADYIAYLTGSSLSDSVFALQAQVPGVTFAWSLPAGVVQVSVAEAQ
jgi:hypothetical protein